MTLRTVVRGVRDVLLNAVVAQLLLGQTNIKLTTRKGIHRLSTKVVQQGILNFFRQFVERLNHAGLIAHPSFPVEVFVFGHSSVYPLKRATGGLSLIHALDHVLRTFGLVFGYVEAHADSVVTKAEVIWVDRAESRSRPVEIRR